VFRGRFNQRYDHWDATDDNTARRRRGRRRIRVAAFGDLSFSRPRLVRVRRTAVLDDDGTSSDMQDRGLTRLLILTMG